MMFENRIEAGRQLARILKDRGYDASYLVLGIPRGGVIVAAEVARFLRASLDIFVVRKLGLPGHEELAMGAIAPGNWLYLDEDLIEREAISPEQIQQVIRDEEAEMQRRLKAYRDDESEISLEGKKIIVVDDGLATGASMRIACQALLSMKPQSLCIALPVAPKTSLESFLEIADDIVCIKAPERFYGVGQWYRHFPQTSDREVEACLVH